MKIFLTAVPRECFQVGKSTTYFELVWRDFFRFITLKYGASRLRSGANGNLGAGTKTMETAGVKHQMMSAVAH